MNDVAYKTGSLALVTGSTGHGMINSVGGSGFIIGTF